jgi:hypothetical protein
MQRLAICLRSCTFLLTFATQVRAQQLVPLHSPEVRRYALIFGAEHYDSLAPATNAINDAVDIARTLRQANFSYIRFVIDPRNEAEITQYLDDVQQWTGNDNVPAIVLFFFAGHGFEINHAPYIVPVGARNGHLAEDSVPLSSILSKLAFHQAGISIFLLDACRTGVPDSPNRETVKTAAIENLASQPSIPALKGTAKLSVQFATESGAPAYSSASPRARNSPFTKVLADNIPQPEVSVRDILDLVKALVPALTHQTQFAVETGTGILTKLYFLPIDAQLASERKAWMDASGSGLQTCVDFYMSTYPGSPYLTDALAWSPPSESSASAKEETHGCMAR